MSVKEVDKITDILRKYQEAPGQVVNLEKSEASFSQNMDVEDINLIHKRMGVKTVMAHGKYLGLPIIFCRSKKIILS